MFNILIVEDEQIEREALKLILNRGVEGVHIYEAKTGSEAMSLIDAHRDIDLVLLDISIPLPNGVEVLRYLRQQERQAKVVITTANDDFDIARTMIGLKADEYLLKPIRPQALVDVVRAYLDIDQAYSQRLQELVKKMQELVEEDLYPQWHDMLRQHLELSCSQPSAEVNQLLNEFVCALIQLSKQNVSENYELKIHADNLKKTIVNKKNYYSVLNQLTKMATLVFQEISQRLGVKRNSIQKALYYIEQNLKEPITLESVAERAHVSPSYLSRLFKSTMEVSFVTYVTERRILLAKHLLKLTDLPIHHIALELSYHDANYFGRIFKKSVGLTLSEYRKQLGSFS